MQTFNYKLLLLLTLAPCIFCSLPDEGKWNFNLTSSLNNDLIISRSMFKNAQIFIKLNCHLAKPDTPTNVTLSWMVIKSECWDCSDIIEDIRNNQYTKYLSNSTMESKEYQCDNHIVIKEKTITKDQKLGNLHPVYIIREDGVYVVWVKSTGNDYNLLVHIEMRSDYGFLSAADMPLLRFYGFMCIFYVLLGILWLIFSFLQWRDLLRVQFWIGGVILLGMLEKATFYAEYQSINSSGIRVQGAMLFGELVSCAKRTLARMLVIIVSLGFGIVKPRLGAALHRVVGVGMLYFILAACESYLRVYKAKTDQNHDVLVASVPLAVLDSTICWWIFSALVHTTRTLRLRRNEVKLNLYRHFTHTLIFSVVASIIFMLYSIKTHRTVTCLVLWKDLWLEEAYWHLLFSSLLLVIMILWRPTNNNQRYAFVPLLETVDEEEEEHLVNDAYGVKVRNINRNSSSSPKQSTVDDNLKWLEDNVSLEPALPVLDSDEELANTRFELSKIQ